METMDMTELGQGTRVGMSKLQQAYRLTVPFAFLIFALLIFPTRLTPIGMVGVLGFLALRWVALGTPFPKTKINPWMLVFLAAFAFGLVVSAKQDTAWMVASYTLAGILAFVGITDFADTTAHAVTAMGVMVLIGVVFAFGAPFAADWKGSTGFDFGALTTHYFPQLARPSNVNNVAGALEVAVPFALALIAINQKPWRIIGALALAPLLLMLLLLQSRGAWLAVAMGMVVYATLYRRWVLPFVPLVLLGALLLNNVFGDPLPTRDIGGDSAEVVTLGDRTQIWKEAARLWVGSPLLGIGVNGFAAYGAPTIGEVGSTYALVDSHAHNVVIQIALDTGLIGVVAFLGMNVLAVLGAWQVYRRSRAGSPERALAIGLLAAFVVILVHGMFDTIFWGFKAEIFLWAALALSLVLKVPNQAANQSHEIRQSFI